MRFNPSVALCALAACLLPCIAHADPVVYGGGAGGSIPDNNALGISSTITVADTFDLTTFDSITLFGLNHTFLGDLIVTLSHNGTTVDIFDRVQGNGQQGFGDDSNLDGDYTFARVGGNDFNAAAAALGDTEIVSAASPYATVPTGTTGAIGGSSSFDGSLSDFDNDKVFGTWTLNVSDRGSQDTGSFTGWSFSVQGTGTGSGPSASAPEPGTFALALPLVGALIAGRRKRSA